MNDHTDIDQAESAGIESVCDPTSIVRSDGAQLKMVARSLICALALLFASPAGMLAQTSVPPDPARETLQTVDRAFGLQIGDVVTRSIRTTGNAALFAPDRLPEPGPVSAWLYLLAIEVDKRTDQAGDATWLTLTYQITGAAPAVTLLDLPALRLLGTGQESATLARLDAIPVSVSPIIGEQPFQRTGLGDLQPDALVPALPSIFWQKMMWAMAALTVLLTALLLGRLWWRQRPDQQSPFVQASARLKSERTLGVAYQHLHRAFDRTARQSMMRDDIPVFIKSNPAYKQMHAEIIEFFEASRNQFFNMSGKPDAVDPNDARSRREAEIRRLQTMADKLARIEKRLL